MTATPSSPNDATLTYDQDHRADRLLAVIKRITRVMNRKGSVQEIWEE